MHLLRVEEDLKLRWILLPFLRGGLIVEKSQNFLILEIYFFAIYKHSSLTKIFFFIHFIMISLVF